MEFVDKKIKPWLQPKLEWLRESWQEVRHKVTWPSKDEVWGTTRVVVVAVLVFAVVVGAMDYLMGFLVRTVFKAVA